MVITYSNTYNNKPIQADEHLGYGCNVDILARADALLQHMENRHCKVLFVRFDVRFPQDGQYKQNNTLFTNFMATFIKYCQRKKFDPAYLWVREQDSAHNQHYHCVLLLNGNKVQHYLPLLQRADTLWQQQLGVHQKGLVHYCNSTTGGDYQQNGLMLRQDKHAQQGVGDICFNWASYLAKMNTKEEDYKGARKVGNSRIPKGLYLESLAQHQQATKDGSC